jgi:hypothetical protein
MPLIEELAASVGGVSLASLGECSDEDEDLGADVLGHDRKKEAETTVAAQGKKKKGKGNKKKKGGAESATPSGLALVARSGGAISVAKHKLGLDDDALLDAAAQERKRYDSAQLLVNLYANNARLTPGQLAGRQRFAADDGVWNPQTDLWLRDAVTAAQR